MGAPNFPRRPLADKFLYTALVRVNAYKCAKFQHPNSITLPPLSTSSDFYNSYCFYLVLYRSTFELTLNFCTAPMVYAVIGALEILNDDDDDDNLVKSQVSILVKYL